MNHIFIFFLWIVSFTYRFIGITDNHPFWVDEFSSARQATRVLIESHNITTYSLISIFFKIFEPHEWSARLPFVFIGSFVPVVIYFLAKYIFDKKTAVSAALLAAFSYFMITWSKQARGYVLLQLIILLAMFLYLKLVQEENSRKLNFSLFLVTILLGIFTHFLFYIFLAALFIHFMIFNSREFAKFFKNFWLWIVIFFMTFIFYKIGSFGGILNFLRGDSFGANNLWYYHAFLWREYGLITFLSILGLIFGLKRKREETTFFAFYITAHLLFLSFILKPYVSRYLLSVFPLILILASYALTEIMIKMHKTLPLILTVFIIINGDKFVIKPKAFYSVNHDFREIALIDYHQVYNLIKKNGGLEEGKTAVIDTWHDRIYWYLGDNYPNAYIFRWINEAGLVNGLPQKTAFIQNGIGEKIIPQTNNLRLVGELSDLKKAMAKYSKGFIFIDDSSLPKDIREYAEKNFKKELYLDHYPLDDNPYSIWPATLYSWGI